MIWILMESWKIAACQTENSIAVSDTSIDSTKARMANFCPQIIISNFFLIFLQDSRLGSTQQTVKKWLIGKEFLPPAKQYFLFCFDKAYLEYKNCP